MHDSPKHASKKAKSAEKCFMQLSSSLAEEKAYYKYGEMQDAIAALSKREEGSGCGKAPNILEQLMYLRMRGMGG